MMVVWMFMPKTWIGMASAVASTSWSAVMMAQEKSRAMPMTAERALCSTVLVISRQIASKRLAMTARSRALSRSSLPAGWGAVAVAVNVAVAASFMAWRASSGRPRPGSSLARCAGADACEATGRRVGWRRP